MNKPRRQFIKKIIVCGVAVSAFTYLFAFGGCHRASSAFDYAKMENMNAWLRASKTCKKRMASFTWGMVRPITYQPSPSPRRCSR